MSHTQIINFRFFKQLLVRLEEYGLNPYEWRIERQASEAGTLRLCHRRDPGFQFKGRALLEKSGRVNWQELTLISI